MEIKTMHRSYRSLRHLCTAGLMLMSLPVWGTLIDNAVLIGTTEISLSTC
jgi:hypothetical protein